MRLRTILSSCVLALLPAAVPAQYIYEDGEGTEYEFRPHVFVELQGGAQHTLGETKFSKLLSPNAQVAVGYQLTPVLAVRLAGGGWQSRGGWNGYMVSLPDGSEHSFTQEYKYKYLAGGLDVAVNLSNLFCGWNPKRVFSLTAFAGGGANLGFDNGEVNAIAQALAVGLAAPLSEYQLEYAWRGKKVRPFGRAGLQAAFRIADFVSLTVEGNANVLSDKYNSKKAGNPDWYFNGLVGLRFNLGGTNYRTEAQAAEPEPEPVVIEKPVAVEPAAAQPAQPAPAVVVSEQVEPIRRDVFFAINSSAIRQFEAQKIKEIGEYLTRYPKARVSITGYADAGTGNDAINERLAAARADAVVNALKHDYRIAGDRIIYDYKGSRVQPFVENDLNRVAICVAE